MISSYCLSKVVITLFGTILFIYEISINYLKLIIQCIKMLAH